MKCRKSPCSPAAASICCWGWGSQPPRVLSSQPQVEPRRRRSSSKKKNQTLKGERLPVSPERPSSSVPPAPRAQPHSLQDRARPSGNGARGAWETPGGTSGTWTLPRFWARTKPQGAGTGVPSRGPRAFSGRWDLRLQLWTSCPTSLLCEEATRSFLPQQGHEWGSTL